LKDNYGTLLNSSTLSQAAEYRSAVEALALALEAAMPGAGATA